MSGKEMFIKKQFRLTGRDAQLVALRHNMPGVTPYINEKPAIVVVVERMYKKDKLTNQETMMYEKVVSCD